MKKTSLPYMPALDGLRGLAILCVLIFHANVHYLTGGFLGVDIFFVLSGFLISALLVSEFNAQGFVCLRNFYIRRVLRLAPPLLLMLFIFALANTLINGLVGLEIALKEVSVVLLQMANWARAYGIYAPHYLGHAWSLSAEEQFYLLWPAVLVVVLRISARGAFLLAIVTALASAAWRAYLAADGASIDRLYNGLDTRLDGLMLGSALGCAYALGWLEQWCAGITQRTWLLLAISALGLILFFIFTVKLWMDMRLYYGLLFVFQLLVVILLLSTVNLVGHSWNKPLISWSAVKLGGISYALYLWHFPIYTLLREQKFGAVSILVYGGALTFLLAWLSQRWCEQPLQKLRAAYRP